MTGIFLESRTRCSKAARLRRASVSALLEQLLGSAVAVLLFAMMVVTCIDVAGRYAFDAPLQGAVEINELLLGVIVFGAFPLVTKRGEHVSITLVDKVFSAAADRVRKAGLAALSCVVLAVMTWQLYEKALVLADYGDRTSYLALPLAPLAFFLSAATGLTTMIQVALLVTGLRVPAQTDQGVDLD